MDLSREDVWMDWMVRKPALDDKPVLLMREGWESPLVMTRKDMNPETNSYGLYWKRTGIYSEAEAKMDPSMLVQLESTYGMGLSGFLGNVLGCQQGQFGNLGSQLGAFQGIL
jgi:hypothetical protein